MHRIHDVWGARTPRPRAAADPRVDRWVQSARLLGSDRCGCDIAVKDGRMVRPRFKTAGRRVTRLGPAGKE